MPEDFTQATIRNLSRAGEMSGPETRALTLLAQAVDQLNTALTAHIAECHHPAPPVPRHREPLDGFFASALEVARAVEEQR